MGHEQEIQSEVVSALAELFALDPATVGPTSRLVEDLDLDSIDAIEMAVRLEERVGFEFKGPELRAVRTIQDIVELIRARRLQEATVGAQAEPGRG
jgi:acyl carrier protein